MISKAGHRLISSRIDELFQAVTATRAAAQAKRDAAAKLIAEAVDMERDAEEVAAQAIELGQDLMEPAAVELPGAPVLEVPAPAEPAPAEEHAEG